MPRPLIRALFVLGVGVGVAVAATGGWIAWQHHSDTASIHVRGVESRSLVVGGASRRYLLVRPRKALAHRSAVDQRSPQLIVLFHGAYQSGARLMRTTDGTALADRTDSLVAYPDGNNHTWDVDGLASTRGADDLAFYDAIVRDVARRDHVDTRRVVVGGFSVGGMLALRIACARATSIAGVVDASGSMLKRSTPSSVALPPVTL